MARTTVVRRYTPNQAEALMNGSKPQVANKKKSVYQIEKDIPIPSRIFHEHRYPLLDMEPGDSFGAPLSESRSIRAAIARMHKSGKGFRFISRTVPVNNKIGKEIRVWRITE